MEKLRYSSFLFVLSFNMVGYNTAESNKELGPPQEVANENDSIGIDTYQIEVPAFDAEEISRNPTVDRVEAVTLVRKYLGLQDNDQLHVDVDHEDEKKYVVQVYDVVMHDDISQTATYGWYYVDKQSGEIVDMFQ